jgi:hypothetical protein
VKRKEVGAAFKNMAKKIPTNPLENDPQANEEAEGAVTRLRRIVEEENEKGVKAGEIGERNVAAARKILQESREESLQKVALGQLKRAEEALDSLQKIKAEREGNALSLSEEEKRFIKIVRERKFYPPSEIKPEDRDRFEEVSCPNCGGTGFDGACEVCFGAGKILVLKKGYDEYEDWQGIGS